MHLRSLFLQHFRNYTQETFHFNPSTTIIVGRNTAGKTNLVEGVMLLSSGKSFRTSTDRDLIAFGQEVGRVQGQIEISNVKYPISNMQVEGVMGLSHFAKASRDKGGLPAEASAKAGEELQDPESIKLEVTIAQGNATAGRLLKRLTVNDVPKSRANFVGNLPAVLFNPEALEIIVDGPSLRREFLNSVLESVDGEYVRNKTLYDKALRQRNALLSFVQETGRRDTQQFTYWDEILITNGEFITKRREEFIAFVNNAEKPLFDFQVLYDKSVISEERLLQYEAAEVGSGMTLVGPQRDDFLVEVVDPFGTKRNIAHFGSRGQQRLVVLQLKLLHMHYIQATMQTVPLLVLDDIFSELDDGHIARVLEKIAGRQVILTTTHEEFVKDLQEKASVVELK